MAGGKAMKQNEDMWIRTMYRELQSLRADIFTLPAAGTSPGSRCVMRPFSP